MKKRPTLAQLRKILKYDPETGIFTWLRDHNNGRMKYGSRAGRADARGYRAIGIDNELYSEHHLAWVFVYGEWPKQIDHKNRNKSDNRIANLRKATTSQNALNRKYKGSRSGHRNIFLHKGKYKVELRVDGVLTFFGYFTSLKRAIKVRNEARISHGEFA